VFVMSHRSGDYT